MQVVPAGGSSYVTGLLEKLLHRIPKKAVQPKAATGRAGGGWKNPVVVHSKTGQPRRARVQLETDPGMLLKTGPRQAALSQMKLQK